jgi:hypothetical protein
MDNKLFSYNYLKVYMAYSHKGVGMKKVVLILVLALLTVGSVNAQESRIGSVTGPGNGGIGPGPGTGGWPR